MSYNMESGDPACGFRLPVAPNPGSYTFASQEQTGPGVVWVRPGRPPRRASESDHLPIRSSNQTAAGGTGQGISCLASLLFKS